MAGQRPTKAGSNSGDSRPREGACGRDSVQASVLKPTTLEETPDRWVKKGGVQTPPRYPGVT